MSGNEVWQSIWGVVSGYGYVYLNLRPWDDRDYQALRTMIETVPLGSPRDDALVHITDLDCADPDPALASCNPSVPPPPEAAAWRQTLETARVDDKAYAAALARVLRGLVCSGGDDAIYIARGDGFQNRLQASGAVASDLIGDLTNKDSKDCPVAAGLTDADRADLFRIKRDIENAGKY